MRLFFAGILLLLSLALGFCGFKAYRSTKSIGRSVALLDFFLIPPILGNLIIICSHDHIASIIGFYIYFLGMDIVIYGLFQFALEYCLLLRPDRKYRQVVSILLALDAIQLLCNLIFGHAFSTESITADGAVYYRIIPYFGQTVHRVVVYGIFFAVLVIFMIKIIRTPRINAEKYTVILIIMVITGIWETFYIFSRTPIDRSMVGFGVFGLLVFYFSMYYRPMRLLDRMLANIASELPDALFFFDANGKCIWANNPGLALVGLTDGQFDRSNECLVSKFGEFEDKEDGWTMQHEIETGEKTKSYILEKQIVLDDKGRDIASFLRIRDNTDEQQTLQQEIFRATHDVLTGLYNRAGYDVLISETDLNTACMIMIDVDHFKEVNDTFGHETGDRVLVKTAGILQHCFRSQDHICRIGGDEFIVILTGAGQEQRDMIASRLFRINENLEKKDDDLPTLSISAGIAFGNKELDAKQLFENADKAVYEAKNQGRHRFIFYDDI